MDLDRGRVVEVYSPAGSQFGSGYLIANELVLTARHVVSGRCEVRPLGESKWLKTAKVVWPGERCDAALLLVPGLKTARGVRLGRVATGKRASCRAVGFPWAQARGRVRDTEEIIGEVAPLAAAKRGLLTIHIDGSVPEPEASGHSPWEGMSGAALFCDRLLVGVVVVDPARFGTDRLEAVPTTAMANEARFRDAVGIHAAELLPALEDEPLRALLDAPYEPLPAGASAELLRRSPIHLLNPRLGIVPFHGRATELDELTGWLDGDELRLALLLGRGGSGKTRLAAELCRSTEEDGWLAGFFTSGEDPKALLGAVSPQLLVLDEAETRIDDLAALIMRFAHGEGAAPTRLLLLARTGGEWWDHTLPQRLGGDLKADIALAGAWVRELGPLEESERARRDVFREAVRAFATQTERSGEEPAGPDLTQKPFERVLFIHFAALSALEGRPAPAGPLVHTELLRARLEQETRHWEASARQNGLESVDARVRRRAVALATLTNAESEAEAATALTAVPDLADESEAVRRRIANWLRSLYPGEGYFRALEPDLLGEALVNTVLADVPELAERLLARSTPTQARRCLTVLNRAAHSDEAAAVALKAALRKHLSSLSQIAIEVAQETGDPIGYLLSELLEQGAPAEIAEQILTHLPQRTVALRELAAVAVRQAYDRVLTEPAGRQRDERAAGLLIDLSIRLRDVGRREQAVSTIEEAVAAYRKLAEGNPDAFPNLATALNNLSVQLADLGRRERALDAIEEAVAIDRRLAEGRPNAYQPDLARALSNLSSRLSDLGRRERALDAIEEAVTIRRRLAEALPDTFQPDLASALNNFSNRLADLGRRERALDAIEEAVAIDRRLAEGRPDAFLPELAMALTNLSRRLVGLGRREQVLEAIEEAVAIYRRLAEDRPDAFLPYLATALSDLSNGLADLGRHEQAYEAIEDAVTIRRRLADARPDAFQPDLAGELNNLSNRLSDLGRYEPALEVIEEAVAAYRNLAEARPDAFLPDLAMALNNLSVQLTYVGRHELALEAIEEAVAIRRRLAEANPDAFLPDLALALNNLGNALADLGQLEPALEANEETVAAYRSLAEANPDAFNPGLARALNNHGNRLADLGRHEPALEANEEAVAIYRNLAQANPDAFQPGLTHALGNLSVRLADLGRHEQALEAIEEAVTAYRNLAQANPDAFQPDLAGALTDLANRLADLGRHEPALEAIEDVVAIYQNLAEARPDTFFPDLATARNNLSIARANVGRHEQALEATEEAVAAYRKLAEANPDAFQPDLAIALSDLANRFANLGRYEPALGAIEEAVAIVLPPVEQAPDSLAGVQLGIIHSYMAFARDVEPEVDAHLMDRARTFLEKAGAASATHKLE